MKNDFDFIKDRVDNSGVNAPAHMDENWAREQLAGVRPKVTPISAAQSRTAPPQKKKRSAGKITAIAAAVVAVAVLGTALTVHFTRNRAVQPAVDTQLEGLIRFSSYDEVQSAVDQLRARSSHYRTSPEIRGEVLAEESDFAEGAIPNGMTDKVGKSSDAKAPASDLSYGGDDHTSHSETYKQVDGVDEGDIVKTDGRYIYVVDSIPGDYYFSRVSVFPAREGVTDPILSIIPGEEPDTAAVGATEDEATPDEPSRPDDLRSDSLQILDLYIRDGRMVVLGCVGGYGYGAAHAGAYYYGSVEAKTRVYVYDIADMDHVRLLNTFTQSGSYTSSRMIGDVLYLVTNEGDLDTIPACGRGDDPEKLEADCIYSVVDPSVSSYLIVSAYHTVDSSAATDSKAVLGLGSDVYCSRDNLYISAADYSGIYRAIDSGDFKDSVVTFGGVDDNDVEYTTGGVVYSPTTKIFKVSLHDGVSFTAYGEVDGYTNNQYSFDEYNGYLRVATTSSNADYEDVNNLYVLDGSLKVVGSVTGFAETESIKAVRYVGDTAYVITYEQTDPLFVIDLSAPAAPAILGEVKISGFSTMLVPIDGDTILGLGVNTGEVDYTDMEVQDGFKLALFDVSDKSAPKVLDSKSYVRYDSEVMYNSKALVFNPERGDYIVPLNYYYFDDGDLEYGEFSDDDDWEAFYDAHTEQYGAVLNFRVEDGRIVVTDLHITEHDRISRCLYVGDTVFMVCFGDDGAAHLDTCRYK